MKKIKRLFKVIVVTIAFIIATCMISSAGYYFYVTHSISLDVSKLDTLKSTSLEIFDTNGKSIKPSSENYTDITKLPVKTKYAFISAEDKRFYSHKGVDYIRIGGAIISNIKSKSFSQGASTISQQLIKNTQLSSEKTISRKLKEIKLTKELEKQYSKDKILELYLNNIYFGNGCYGIENASLHYFSKSAKELSLSESAILAGTINAPSIYDIESNPQKANERKNLILNLMFSYGHISSSECEKAKNEQVQLNISKLSNNNYLYNEIIKEACEKLKISENLLKSENLKIYSHIDTELESEINKIIKNNYSNLQSSPKIASIVIDNETNGIVAVCGEKSTLNCRRQPGSTIKPILVFAPAIENNIVSPATKIIDEKVQFSGYSPENADKKYHGAVSVRTSLKNSYNIPAVKLLNEIGIEKAQNFAKNLGIIFSEKDNNLAIALGGFTDGTTLFELANAYCAIANYGEYSKCNYIQKIVKNHQTIFTSEIQREKVMQDSTAYLITDILKDTSVSGTAKRLKNLGYEIASKTGTVGLSQSRENSDAYNVSYTTKHTIVSFFGKTKMPESINGSTYPTMLTKDVLNELYKQSKPQQFLKPNSVEKINISKEKYENGIVEIADNNEEFITEIFSKNNLPKSKKIIDFNANVINIENKKPIICFNTNDNYCYKIIRNSQEENEKIIYESNNLDNECNNINENSNKTYCLKYEDKSAKSGEIYEYFIEFYDKNHKKTIISKKIKLKTF